MTWCFRFWTNLGLHGHACHSTHNCVAFIIVTLILQFAMNSVLITINDHKSADTSASLSAPSDSNNKFAFEVPASSHQQPYPSQQSQPLLSTSALQSLQPSQPVASQSSLQLLQPSPNLQPSSSIQAHHCEWNFLAMYNYFTSYSWWIINNIIIVHPTFIIQLVSPDSL